MRRFTSRAHYFVILINLVFLVLGSCLIVIGCVTELGSQIIGQDIRHSLEKVSPRRKPGTFSLKTLFLLLARFTIFVGVLVFVVGLLGCIERLCKNKTLKDLYGFMVINIYLLPIPVLIIACVIYTGVGTTIISKDALNDTFTNMYKGRNNTNEAVTAAWNFVFVELKCCGINNYQDAQASTKWNRNVTINGVAYYLKAPLSCCKNVEGTFPDYTFANGNCGSDPDSENSNFESGCFEAVKDLIQKTSGIFIGVSVGTAVIGISSAVAVINIHIRDGTRTRRVPLKEIFR